MSSIGWSSIVYSGIARGGTLVALIAGVGGERGIVVLARVERAGVFIPCALSRTGSEQRERKRHYAQAYRRDGFVGFHG